MDARHGIGMQPLYQIFDSLKLADDRFSDRLPNHITDNLAPHINLRPYQVEALNRYLYYCDSYKNRTDHNTNLLFNMATGSGKTVIMAALILDLYKRGYNKFVFFVNRKTIVQKTIENFTNPASSKYLFADTLNIDGQTPGISAVDTLNSGDESDIQILFTTIQGLHNDLFTPREGHITLEDMAEEKIVLLSDEAHHINAWTTGEKLGKEEEQDKKTWERGVERVFKQNSDNVLLEFTATLDNDRRILDKYHNVLLYKYDLKQFRNDGYSKEISLYSVSDDIRQRMLQAVLISQFRLLVAEEHRLLLKPVILFKSKNIQSSKDNHEMFTKVVQGITEDEIQDEFSKHETLKKLGEYLKSHSISLNHFIDELKIAFDVTRVRNVNDEKDAETLQLDINRLEDSDNEIRVIFAVDKLNEGWDVLNLFDIVRLYETRDGQYSRGGEYTPGRTTISEAQLIGRGARYWPFVYKNEPVDQRKFNGDVANELRLLEEMYYHSMRDTDYLIEIRSALVETGMMDREAPETIELKLKKSFKNKTLYKSGYVYANSLEDNPRADKKTATDYLSDAQQLQVKLPTHSIETTRVFDDTASVVRDDSVVSRSIKFDDIPGHIVAKALDKRYKFYNFTNLKRYLPELSAKQDFVTMLAGVSIKVFGSSEQLYSPNPNTWVKIIDSALAQVEDIISSKESPKVGTKQFAPLPFRDVFREKKVLVERAKGSLGTPMKEESDALYLDLTTREWYVYEEEYGDSYEKMLVKFIDAHIDALHTKWEELYLVRNERDLKLFDFDSDKVFMPDYLLFLKRKGATPHTYYVFMEPKGENIEAGEAWKRDFLFQLEKQAEVVNDLGIYQSDIKIIGMDFYQPATEGKFEEKFEEKLV